MRREELLTIASSPARETLPCQAAPGATRWLAAVIAVFIVLTGIWACLWVPPS
jgi:hypothetical protein